jgi:hypothetical protein
MMFSPNTEEEGARQPFTVPLPFLRESIGSGDMVKRLTDALHIRQCGGCEQRQEQMNQAVGFRPMRSLWED